MRLLVVGCGSIGRRHAANAAALGEAAVVDIDPAAASACAEDLGTRAFATLDEALGWGPEAAIVATPHDAHLPVALRCIEAGCHVLVEKPIADRLDGLDAFLDRADALGRRVFVVCNMRFHPGVAALKQNLSAVGRPLFARAQYGNYLPSMRPGVDYRTLYAASRAQGGGVIRDAIHEIDYLSWLFGTPIELQAAAARLSDLAIDVEDYAGLLIEHELGTRSEIHLDYLQRFKRRGCEIAGTDGTLVWASEGRQPERCTVRLYRAATDAWEILFDEPAIDVAAPYRALLATFADAVEGKPRDLLDGRAAALELAAALAGLRAAETSQAVAPASLIPHRVTP